MLLTKLRQSGTSIQNAPTRMQRKLCSGRSIQSGRSVLNAPAGMRLFRQEHSEMAGAFWMLMPARVCSGRSILFRQEHSGRHERSECSCRHASVPA